MSGAPDDYRVFDRSNDLVVEASWLLAHPEFQPFAEALASTPFRPEMDYLAGEGDIAETIVAAGGHDYPDLTDVAVTLLLDQSGSQNGPQLPHIVSFVDRTVEALFHMGAAVEVLGFTTQRWKGGLARQRWLDAGKPVAPGRLNDLLHIVYKESGQPWRLAVDGPSPRESFSRIFRKPYMREGLDGEAVAWATERMLTRPQPTRVMIVCSDVAPVDDATLSVNRSGLLDDHLRRAVAAAESRGIAVVSVSDGFNERNPRTDIYARVAYESDWTRFDAAAAAAGVMAKVAEIAAPAPSPAP